MKLKDFTLDIVRRDFFAGSITGLMAIPLTIGLCLMSEYPVQTGLVTVIFACIIGFIAFLFRPGNYVGTPGIAAGLAPVLALGIHQFGMENMAFLIFLTATFQAIIWKYNLQKFILKAVPHYLVEGLLAGVGLKIALKFLPYTTDTIHVSDHWFDEDRFHIIFISVAFMILFLYLFSKFKKSQPGVPYVAVIGLSIWLSQYMDVPMLHIEHVPIQFVNPFEFTSGYPPMLLLTMVGYALMLATIDVIEQVMSNAAIEKIDPLQRKCNTNNSLLAIWVANMGSSFFGGMTNLDGLAKSTTNRMAGAITKLSNLFTAIVLSVVVIFPHLLSYLPEFSLAVLMVFTGWRMIAGVFHVASHGKYPLILSLFCGILVFKMGIFEGLLISLAVHSFITYIIYRHHATPFFQIVKAFLKKFTDEIHPHSSEHLAVHEDPLTGALRYSSVAKNPGYKKELKDFIKDWADGVNNHNLLSVVGTYDASGLLWGTFAKDLRTGHFHIKRYFEHLFELDKVKVCFEAEEVRQYKDIFIQSGSYVFSYDRKGVHHTVPARYSFVCKKEKTGWYILEHHSSEFPA
ncbi:MAG: SulP family inorganic anion transporter [Flavobacteriales bacterium]